MGQKFRRWSHRNFGDEASEMREQMRNREGIKREEPAHNVLMREKFQGENIIKYIIFDTILATVQFYVQNCTVALLQKILQQCCLPFSDEDGFGVKNAKFPLDLALAFPNANALKK